MHNSRVAIIGQESKGCRVLSRNTSDILPNTVSADAVSNGGESPMPFPRIFMQ